MEQSALTEIVQLVSSTGAIGALAIIAYLFLRGTIVSQATLMQLQDGYDKRLSEQRSAYDETVRKLQEQNSEQSSRLWQQVNTMITAQSENQARIFAQLTEHTEVVRDNTREIERLRDEIAKKDTMGV
jgi:septal ring factor EnvC (AmiA/AmiB activator)